MKFFVYILQNEEGRFYVGHTGDLANRITSHNRADEITGKYTRKNGPWRLVWVEEHETRAAAMRREKEIKSMKSAKWIREKLLNGIVPTRRDEPASTV